MIPEFRKAFKPEHCVLKTSQALIKIMMIWKKSLKQAITINRELHTSKSLNSKAVMIIGAKETGKTNHNRMVTIQKVEMSYNTAKNLFSDLKILKLSMKGKTKVTIVYQARILA